MDIRDYFDAINFSQFYKLGNLNWKHTLGAEIEKSMARLNNENIGSLDIAIVGSSFDSRKNPENKTDTPDRVREEIYLLSGLNVSAIADFGNLKPASSSRGNFKALRDIVDYFNELGIVTIVIGGSQDLSTAICEAFQNNPLLSFSTIDAFFDIKKTKEPLLSTNYLTRIFKLQPNIFQFNLIGYQRHHVAPGSIEMKAKGINQNISLGQLRGNISHVEPILRNTDILSFDIGAVKYAEAPGNRNFNPNGLQSEEACELAKYAGLSSRLKVFGLFELNTENDKNNLTVKLAAQIIWYFIEGLIQRNYQNPENDKNMVRYQVEIESIDKPMVFYKNIKINQWWIQIITMQKKIYYFACTEEVYKLAANNEIPELWLRYIQKLDKILK